MINNDVKVVPSETKTNSHTDPISKRKRKAVLTLIILCFLLTIPASYSSSAFGDTNQSSTTATWVEIDCSLTPSFNNSSFGNPPTNGNFMPDQFGNGTFAPDQFGDGAPGNFTPGNFGTYGNFTPSDAFNRTMPSEFGSGRTLVMQESSYSDVNSIAGVVAVVPVLQFSENQNPSYLSIISISEANFTRSFQSYIIVGVPLSSSIIDTYPILPTNITTGRNLQASDSDVLVISESNSAYFDAGVGDSITLMGQPFEVVGIHGVSSGMDSLTLYMSLSDAQALTNNTGNITNLKVFANSNADVASIVSAIQSLHPELSVVTAQDSGASTSSLFPSPAEQTSTSPAVQSGSSSDFVYIAIAVAAVVVVLVVAVVILRRRRNAQHNNVQASPAESGGQTNVPFSIVSLAKPRRTLSAILEKPSHSQL